jgi:hypothetical protein
VTRLIRPTIVFAALVTGGTVMALLGRDLAAHDQLVLVAFGAALVAGSLAAFLGSARTLLHERSATVDWRHSTAVLVALVIGGALMAMAGRGLDSAYEQLVLVSFGAALIAGSLAAFLGAAFELARGTAPGADDHLPAAAPQGATSR